MVIAEDMRVESSDVTVSKSDFPTGGTALYDHVFSLVKIDFTV